MDFLWHFSIGLVISFIGSIPLGTVNLAVVQTTINVNLRAGFYFALGATVIELIYSAIAIKFISVLLMSAHLELVIQMITVPAFTVLGIFYFRKQEEAKAVEVKGRKSFYNGLAVGVINPLQIPFWVTYGSYLLSNNWIQNDDMLLNIFILGACTGTLLILTLIAFASKGLISKFDFQGGAVNKVIGAMLLLLASYQAIKVSMHFI